jgi:two-component system, cell cycle response regulator
VSQPPTARLVRVTRWVERLLLVLAAGVPALGTAYLHGYGGGNRVFMHHGVHEIAIAVSIAMSGFVAYVALQCYRNSGERFVGWLALAMIGETLIYLPHGLFTRLSHDHMALFLIFGPASRLLMVILLLVGLANYDRPPHPPSRVAARPIGRWILAFLVFDAALVWASLAHTPAMPVLRLAFEYAALGATALAVLGTLWRPRASPLMRLYTFSLVGFATSSITFVIASPWTHLWWYAHAIFAAAFLLLGYGVLRAYRATGAFSGVFSQEQLMEHLRSAKQAAEQAALELATVNAQLEVLATTDPLTRTANRRHFLDVAEREHQRSLRNGAAWSLLLIDLDHFKAINDEYGHPSGDRVLMSFVDVLQPMLRKSDLLGRIGGEEFAVLMPGTDLEAARAAAERMRQTVHLSKVTSLDGRTIDVSISIGVAASGPGTRDVSEVLHAADRRLYAAKRAGRDCVIWRDAVAASSHGALSLASS